MGRPPGSKNAAAKKPAAKKSAGKKAAQGNPAPETEAPEAPEAPQMQAAKPAAPPPAKKNGPSSAQTREWLSEYTRLKTQARSIAGDISALGSKVKAAAGQTHWKNLKKRHDLMKMDKSEALAELENLVTQMAEEGVRISWMGNQATMADVLDQQQAPPKNTEGTRDLDEARAHSDGYNSGYNGSIPSDNPFRHIPGSGQYVAWHNGRDEGQMDREKRKPGEATRVKEAMTADATLPSDKVDDGWPIDATKAANDGPKPASKIADPIF